MRAASLTGAARLAALCEAAGGVVIELIRAGRAGQAAEAARLAARIARRALVRERLRRRRQHSLPEPTRE